MNNTKQRKFRLGALDIFIIICLIFCLVAVGARYFINRNSDIGESVQMDSYIISIKILDIKDSSAQLYFEPGSEFYLEETNAPFGTILEGVTISDAEKVYEMPNGDIVIAQNNATGDLYRVDVEASFDAVGRVDSDGRFLLNGNTYIGANKEVKLYSKYLSVTAMVTSVIKSPK